MTNKNKFQKFALVLYIIFVIILFVLFSSVLIKTAQRGDSLSSTGDFSRDGVMDYETTEQNDTSEQDTEGSYELIQGVNGQYEYRCTKICSEECGRACDTCLMNGKSSKRSPKCCFDYSASKPIGWVGCPDCGDISHPAWYDRYRRALGLK